MQIAVLLDVAAVCANVSVGFPGVCYLTIKAVEMQDDGCVALKNKGEPQPFQVLDARVRGAEPRGQRLC